MHGLFKIRISEKWYGHKMKPIWNKQNQSINHKKYDKLI